MSAKVNTDALNYGATNYYDEGLLQIYQDYKTYFRNHKSTRLIPVQQGILYRNENDLFGLMIEMSVPPMFAWFVLMLNDLHTGNPLPAELSLYIPDYDELEKIRSAYEAAKKIT